jgi:hypothetical protein
VCVLWQLTADSLWHAAPAHSSQSLLSEPWAAGDDNDMAMLVQGGISYLDTRTDFWRQQKPMYAREYEQKQRTLKKPLSR